MVKLVKGMGYALLGFLLVMLSVGMSTSEKNNEKYPSEDAPYHKHESLTKKLPTKVLNQKTSITEKNNLSRQKNTRFTVEATAYTSECKGCIGITYSGYDVRNTIYYKNYRIIAVDPNVIPLYSIVEIDIRGKRKFKAIALDVGGAIKGKRIDILFKKRHDALHFGRRDVEVRILRKGE